MAKDLPKTAILVPVDFSPHSEAAVELAIELADALKTPLVVLHVVHDPGEEPGFYARKLKKKQIRKMEDVGSDLLSDFIAEIAKRHPESESISHAIPALLVGLPVTRILELIKKIKPRMVIMGSRGRSGLAHVLVGSRAEQVVHLSPVPVTIVKLAKTPEQDKAKPSRQES